MGRGSVSAEQAGEQMSMLVRYVARKGGDREPTETGNRLRQRTDYCTGTRPNKHREREQRTIQMDTTNEYVLMNERK